LVRSFDVVPSVGSFVCPSVRSFVVSFVRFSVASALAHLFWFARSDQQDYFERFGSKVRIHKTSWINLAAAALQQHQGIDRATTTVFFGGLFSRARLRY
jgi:hypothetical protein